MKRPFLRILPFLLLWVFLAGMAKSPGPEVPLPEIDFKATVRDDQDITTQLSHSSWGGNTFFTGTRGKGSVTISFEKVRKVTSVGSSSGNKKDFQITLKNGDVVAVSFTDDIIFQGTTSFGTFRIPCRNIKEIIFE